ncbi:hypothetical protein E2C01_039619 [Portunus trituberculatus]|uniref:Uncharacterized protein n=1 Tax=Portunus trituberculatus TaxID=210409 RepID=A0A5B7FL59_PORTR|nr:hypothetical protein [Portunus trituberculatus]
MEATHVEVTGVRQKRLYPPAVFSILLSSSAGDTFRIKGTIILRETRRLSCPALACFSVYSVCNEYVVSIGFLSTGECVWTVEAASPCSDSFRTERCPLLTFIRIMFGRLHRRLATYFSTTGRGLLAKQIVYISNPLKIVDKCSRSNVSAGDAHESQHARATRRFFRRDADSDTTP